MPFERRFVPRLTIVDELIRKLRFHLESHGESPEAIRSATLSVELTMGEWEDQKDKSVMRFGDYDGFVGREMNVLCTIRFNEKSYKAKHRGYVEWPKKVENSGSASAEDPP